MAWLAWFGDGLHAWCGDGLHAWCGDGLHAWCGDGLHAWCGDGLLAVVHSWLLMVVIMKIKWHLKIMFSKQYLVKMTQILLNLDSLMIFS